MSELSLENIINGHLRSPAHRPDPPCPYVRWPEGRLHWWFVVGLTVSSHYSPGALQQFPRPPEKLFLRCRGCRGGKASPGTCSSSGSSRERARRSLRGTKCLESKDGCRGGGGGDSRDSCSAGREWGLRTLKLPPPPIPRHLEDRPKLFQLDLRLHIPGRAGRPQLWYRVACPGHWNG